MVKNCDLSLEMLPLAYSLGQYFQDLGHSFSPSHVFRPPSRHITYISLLSYLLIKQNYLVMPLPMQNQSFFSNVPPLFI